MAVVLADPTLETVNLIKGILVLPSVVGVGPGTVYGGGTSPGGCTPDNPGSIVGATEGQLWPLYNISVVEITENAMLAFDAYIDSILGTVGSTKTIRLKLQDLNGVISSNSETDIQVKVTDSVVDFEPSASATLGLNGSGTILSGNGSATATYRFAGGIIDIAVTEPTAGQHRFLWILVSGNSRQFVKALNPVYEVIF